MPGWRVTQGAANPLGVWPEADGVNVAVWSSVGQAVDLCLFNEEGRETRIRLPERTGDVFHGHVAGISEGARYGLRVHGPFDPASGARCDPSKLLVDPYAVTLDGPFALHSSMFSETAPGMDSAPFTPKTIVTAPAARAPPPLMVPWERTVIYEAHVKGLTKLHPDVPEAQRGTFAALGHPGVVAHLKSLGVTTLELLPTAAWIDERHLAGVGLTNYWGYNPVAFAAPDPRLAPGGWPEVRAATAALAGAGIETILDVVFNHSGEGDALGPTLSLRGLDNGRYYRLHPQDAARYIDDSGTGNTLALDRPQGVALAMHALRTWARRGGVSGFRFDLAPVLGRRPTGFDPQAPLLAAIDQDPELGRLKLIAEPWDCGPGGHQLGRFPGAWAEWNDGYRDRVRRFWRGDPAPLGELAEALAGSEPSLRAHRRPSRGVNFVTAHDGFTLADLVSFDAKHNLANGEEGRDGTDHNLSWNNGAEGPTAESEIQRRRRADQRALLATLLLSRGTPMLAMGSEMGHSQEGNNNAYAQDNKVSWLDWSEGDEALRRFTQRVVEARLACPALSADRFLTGEARAHGLPDVVWRRPDGQPMAGCDWEDPAGATLLCILSEPGAGNLSRALIILHRGGESSARLPEPSDGRAWRLAVDTADDDRGGRFGAQEIELNSRSLVLLIEEPAPGPARGPTDLELSELAGQAGIALEWWSIEGQRRQASPETQRALLAAMGFESGASADVRESLRRIASSERRILPWTRVVVEGASVGLEVEAADGWLELITEGGETLPLRLRGGRCHLPPLPLGRHRLRLGEVECALIAVPGLAYEPQPATRRLGLAAQLYAVRGTSDVGLGDLQTLGELARGAAANGLALVGLNPLHALFPDDRSRVSPYYPSDRRFIDPIYIGLPELRESTAGGATLVDYATVWAAKSAVLESRSSTFEASSGHADFEAFIAERGEALGRFCTFQAIAERYPDAPWRRWPSGLDDPTGPSTRAFAQAYAHRVRHHAWLQWVADRQLAEARIESMEFMRDLAIGPAPDGAETWAGQSKFAAGVSIGAPPDPFSPNGQVWGMPPPLPRAWREDGYATFATLLTANMRHAGALRIDHVLGLSRLFWTPDGAGAEQGAYVHYPLDDLLGVIALESVRANCVVVGEDLGTAPEGLRPALRSRRIYSYNVLQFERDGTAYRQPKTYPLRALACASTHDLPTLAGWWEGEDLCERAQLGLLDEAALAAASLVREEEKGELIQALHAAGIGADYDARVAMSDGLAAAIHAWLAQADSLILMLQAEDIAGVVQSVNLPGTHMERANWRRRLPLSLSELWKNPRCAAILAAVTGQA